MIQFKDPCKTCIVRAICNEVCEPKYKYYNDRVSKLPEAAIIIGVLLCISLGASIHLVDFDFPYKRTVIVISILIIAGLFAYLVEKLQPDDIFYKGKKRNGR
jgi:hypothetical protein